MGYTKFGEFIRILRIRNHEVMGDLAKVLEVSLPFLSSVETGKKNVPPNWVNILTDHYKLNEKDVSELNKAIEESQTQMKISLVNTSNIKRSTALQFARSFDNIDEDTAKKIMELLEKKK